jgi:hypothetical protein
MTNVSKFIIVAIIIINFAKINANAEFLCQAEILYKWRKEAAAALPKTDPKLAKPDETPSTENELSVFWTNIEQRGSTEDDAKAKVNKQALNERAGAERACLAAHENLSGCIGSKYAALSSSVTSLGFSARKSIEDAVKTDCEKQQGKCSGSTVGEIKCSELITQAKPTEAPAKDAKGKKK